MRTCPRCGRLITDAMVQFCPNCGQPLASEQTLSQPAMVPPTVGAPPTQPPMQPPMQPPTGPAYSPPPYGPAYGPPSGYPGGYPGSYPGGYPGEYPSAYPSAYPPVAPAQPPEYSTTYRPGADWRPSETKQRPPWGRIIGAIAALLVVVAIIAAIYDQAHPLPQKPVNASATATALTVSSTSLLADPLTSDANGWSVDGSTCFFAHDGYHIRGSNICFAPIGIQSDMTQTVTVKQVQGPPTSAYGLVMRWVSHGNHYFFGIDSNSKWVFEKEVDGTWTPLQDFTQNAAIHGGLNTSNTLSVTASGSTFDCYVNGQHVGTVHDSTFAQGKWGMESNTNVEVVFTDYLAR